MSPLTDKLKGQVKDSVKEVLKEQKEEYKEQGLDALRKKFSPMMIKGIKAATQRIRDLKAQGKFNQMDPELKASIRELCAEAPAQMGGKKTRKRKGKKSKKSYRKKSTAKKTLKRRKKKAGDKLCGPKRVMHHGKCESESVLKMKKMREGLAGQMASDPYSGY